MTLKMTALAALLFAACGGSQTAKTSEPSQSPPAATSAEPAKQVCCESFGYGAQMVECCSTFAWTAADACKVPPGFVGGNKRVVGDDRCPAK